MKVPRPTGLLLATALIAPLVVTAAEPAHAAMPAFQLPFPCGQMWNGDSDNSSAHESWEIDFNRGSGSDDLGDTVVAAADGTVRTASHQGSANGYGNLVKIEHADSWFTYYAHLNTMAVAPGQRVSRGQVIGTVGNTSRPGNNISPHLHYEVRQGASGYPDNLRQAYFNGTRFGYPNANVTSHNCRSTPAPESGLAGGPAAVFGTSLQYYAVGNSTNLDLYSIVYQPGSSWSDWANHRGNIRGKPSVVTYGDTLQIYVRGTDNQLYQKYWSPRTSWSEWIPRGGSLASDPVAIVHRDNLNIFARNGNGNLIHLAYDGGTGGQGWLSWANRGGVFVGKPAAVVYGDTLQIYVRTAGNNLYQKYWSPNSSWSDWLYRGGSIASDPAAIAHRDNLNIFARHTNRSLAHLAYDGGTGGQGWLSWASRGGEFVGNPTAVVYGTSLQIYVRGLNDNLYQKYWSPSSGWSGWSNRGGSVTTDPVPIAYRGNLHIFARNRNGDLTYLPYDGGTGGTGWLPWQNLDGHIL